MRYWVIFFLFFLLLLATAAYGAQPADPLPQFYNTLSREISGLPLNEYQNSGLKQSGAFSVKGFPLLIKEYPPLASRQPQARVLLIGGTHGDEPATVVTVLKWMQKLDRYHSGLFHWIAIPLLNPDGLLGPKRTRPNARGVDLNRNMPSAKWRQAGYQHWIDQTGRDSRQFPGFEPASEPESKFLVKLIEEFKPHAIITIHAPLGIVDYDGPGPAPKQLGRLHFKRLGNFPGTLGNYAGELLGLPVVTIELPSDSTPPSVTDLASMWTDLVSWLTVNVPARKPGKIPAQMAGTQKRAAK
ncbi:MAG: succinylglutamate desuccinylase/aspartoacylase family protein [Deltaproteobacteria bacterium]|nr:succinylglutamate desuccinylase/aspartoacylase family protein [Deltaproteobacteria bacterium]